MIIVQPHSGNLTSQNQVDLPEHTLSTRGKLVGNRKLKAGKTFCGLESDQISNHFQCFLFYFLFGYSPMNVLGLPQMPARYSICLVVYHHYTRSTLSKVAFLSGQP